VFHWKKRTMVVLLATTFGSIAGCSSEQNKPAEDLNTAINSITDELAPETAQPNSDVEQIETETEQPASDANTPVTEEQPADGTDQSATVVEQPADEAQQPVTDAEQPNTDAEQPSTDTEQPVTNDEQPVTDQPAPTIDVPITPDGLISSVSIGGIGGVFHTGSPPEQVGTIAIAPLNGDSVEPVNFISGGSTQIQVVSDSQFTTVFVTTDDNGYFQINLPTATNQAIVVVNYSTIQLDGEQANIDVSVQSATGDVSADQSLAVTSVVVGTGELQVSISWDTETDVDLSLLEPTGNRIDFITDEAPSGGKLDLDSNVFCAIDGINNENITYENVTPPSGEYQVEVSFFSACDVMVPTNYVVTVRNGGSVQTFEGVFLHTDSFINNFRKPVTTFVVP